MKDDKSDILWFVAGAAIGATIALLYAPASGSETRRRIGEKAAEGRDAVSNSSREFYEKGKEWFDRGRHLADEASQLFDRGRKIVEG
ncbi:MAG: YtxH domain-containing protein [Bryobacteraceae bacterium]|nr:YtxH domain-containing protein [Bryobacteraceae bacterium]